MSFFSDLLKNIFKLICYILGIVIIILYIVALASPWYPPPPPPLLLPITNLCNLLLISTTFTPFLRYGTVQKYQENPSNSDDPVCEQIVAFGWFSTKLQSCGPCDSANGIGCRGFVLLHHAVFLPSTLFFLPFLSFSNSPLCLFIIKLFMGSRICTFDPAESYDFECKATDCTSPPPLPLSLPYLPVFRSHYQRFSSPLLR